MEAKAKSKQPKDFLALQFMATRESNERQQQAVRSVRSLFLVPCATLKWEQVWDMNKSYPSNGNSKKEQEANTVSII